jgi:hypothetical protein
MLASAPNRATKTVLPEAAERGQSGDARRARFGRSHALQPDPMGTKTDVWMAGGSLPCSQHGSQSTHGAHREGTPESTIFLGGRVR